MNDETDEKETDLSAITGLFRTLDALEFAIPPATTELYNLCEPEFLALKTQVADAIGRREADITEYSSLLHETMKHVRLHVCLFSATARLP